MRTSFCHRQIWDPRRQCVVSVRARAAPAFHLAPLRHGDMHTINRLVSFDALLSVCLSTPGLRTTRTSDYRRLPGRAAPRGHHEGTTAVSECVPNASGHHPAHHGTHQRTVTDPPQHTVVMGAPSLHPTRQQGNQPLCGPAAGTSKMDISENGPQMTHRPLGEKMDRFDPQEFAGDDERVG